MSSSDNYVGNIFYEYGIVNITETGSYANNYWDLDNTGFETSSPSMTSENNIPHGIFFKPDGTRYYMIGSQGSKEGVYEYSMTTAWDISTATYTGNYFDISHYSADAWRSISFKPDGTRLFLTNEDSDTIKAYDLDIAWDLSSFDTDDFGSIETFNLDGATTIVENKPKGHYFREDGLKLYIVGETNNSAIEYNLSSAFDLTSIIGNMILEQVYLQLKLKLMVFILNQMVLVCTQVVMIIMWCMNTYYQLLGMYQLRHLILPKV